MATYYRANGLNWDTEVFRDSWPKTENFTLRRFLDHPRFFRVVSDRRDALGSATFKLQRQTAGQGVGTFALVLTEQSRERGAQMNFNYVRLKAARQFGFT